MYSERKRANAKTCTDELSFLCNHAIKEKDLERERQRDNVVDWKTNRKIINDLQSTGETTQERERVREKEAPKAHSRLMTCVATDGARRFYQHVANPKGEALLCDPMYTFSQMIFKI